MGIVVIFRSIRMATKFTKAKQIPRSFIRKNVQLNGRVDSINLDGTFKVEHLPIIPLPWHRLYRGIEFLFYIYSFLTLISLSKIHY